MPNNNHTPVTKADFDAGMKALRDYLRDYIDERTRDMQTELLRTFESATWDLLKLGEQTI